MSIFKTANSRLARNTIILNIRMLISVIVSLITSRILLIALGIEDFGIYNVVGGLVMIFSFLNATMSGATSRFITFELGRNSETKRVNEVFSSAMTIHILIAFIIFLIGETIGLYLFKNKVIIPIEKQNIANIIYQLSLISVIFSIIQIPYNASIIAYEKMNVYAYIEISRTVLRLGIVYALLLVQDKLLVYSYMILILSTTITLGYYFYCIKYLPVCRFQWVWNKKIILPIISFSALDLYGNACVAIREQGNILLINNFFGVAVNAAAGIANQASTSVYVFTNSITMAFRPQIIKEYARGNIKKMESLLCLALSICLFIMTSIITPIYLYMQPIMELWLAEVPLFTVDFCRMLLFVNLVLVINSIFVICIHATGRIKYLSFIGGSLFLLSIFCTYFSFRSGLPVITAYYIWLAFSVIILTMDMIILKKEIKSLCFINIAKSQFRPLLCILLSILCIVPMSFMFEINIYMCILISIINMLLLICFGLFFWILPTTEKDLKTMIALILNKRYEFFS